jgi:nucleotide-binding universal stress UspA family protein
MFEHLLVPLDGSKLAEAALPVAAWLSHELVASVTLIHIIEQDPPQAVHGDRHLADEGEARRYLEGIAAQQFIPGKVFSHVHTEKVQDVARSIADHSGELSPDLIVMCTHGEGGLRDIVAGSIAQQVIGRGKTPIFLVPPASKGAAPQIKKFMVAIDGAQLHTGALPVAAELAGKVGASLHLLTVVHTLGTLSGERAASGWMLPGATRAMLEIDEETAREDLEKQAVDLRKTGLTVTCEVRRGNPAQQIIAGATASKSDCIVLATHGKSGMNALWASSVGPKVVSAAHLPLLLIPVKK